MQHKSSNAKVLKEVVDKVETFPLPLLQYQRPPFPLCSLGIILGLPFWHAASHLSVCVSDLGRAGYFSCPLINHMETPLERSDYQIGFCCSLSHLKQVLVSRCGSLGSVAGQDLTGVREQNQNSSVCFGYNPSAFSAQPWCGEPQVRSHGGSRASVGEQGLESAAVSKRNCRERLCTPDK